MHLQMEIQGKAGENWRLSLSENSMHLSQFLSVCVNFVSFYLQIL